MLPNMISSRYAHTPPKSNTHVVLASSSSDRYVQNTFTKLPMAVKEMTSISPLLATLARRWSPLSPRTAILARSM